VSNSVLHTVSRALVLCLALLYLPAGHGAAPVILVLGDSLSAAHNLEPSQGWVSLLARRLADSGYPHQVINASISGDTSYDGLRRLPASLQKHRPRIVILELGANDGLRGLPLSDLRHNLTRMIQLARDAGAQVLLLGMRLPPNYGPAYTRGFADIYASLAREQRTALCPFLLAGVANRRDLMQEDNLHPTAAAQPMLLDTVWSELLPLLKGR
jgi:acyl-CoA thioesterase-1